MLTVNKNVKNHFDFSHTIGVEGSNRSINNTGIFICFGPNTVPSNTVVSSHVYCECQHPLDTTETLVSRVVSLEVVPEKLNNKSFTMVIPHSVVHCLWWLYRECYETVVKEFCQDSNSWRDVESHTYNSVWDQEGTGNISYVRDFFFSLIFLLFRIIDFFSEGDI